MINIISIKSIFILLTCLIAFSCVEQSIEPESNGINEELNRLPVVYESTDSIYTVYIEWYSHVTKAERNVIRNSYRDPNGEIVILSDDVCSTNIDVETWVISFDDSNYNKCCTPEPKVIIKDNEGEMSKVSYVDLCND